MSDEGRGLTVMERSGGMHQQGLVRDSLKRVISRFRGSVPVREAMERDAPMCITLALEYLSQSGTAGKVNVSRVSDHIQSLIVADDAAVFLAAEGRSLPVGMVCCGVIPPEPWEYGETLGVWLLYVIPSQRRRAGILTNLLDQTAQYGRQAGVSRFRVTVAAEDAKLSRFYERRLGFTREFQQTIYSLRMEV